MKITQRILLAVAAVSALSTVAALAQTVPAPTILPPSSLAPIRTQMPIQPSQPQAPFTASTGLPINQSDVSGSEPVSANTSFTNTAPTYSNGNIRTQGGFQRGTPASFRNQNLVVGNPAATPVPRVPRNTNSSGGAIQPQPIEPQGMLTLPANNR